jgi:hypothetical protein
LYQQQNKLDYYSKRTLIKVEYLMLMLLDMEEGTHTHEI